MKLESGKLTMEEKTISFNNCLILEPYLKTKEIKQTEVATGFVMAQAKVSLEGLKLLSDAVVQNGTETIHIPKGSVAYFKEEILLTQPWSRKTYSSNSIDGGFIIGNFNDVVFVEPNNE